MKKILILIVLFGAILRFSAVNWDSFGAFHPDERNISWAVTRIQFFNDMNPKFFAYGGLPIYLYRALAESVAYFSKDLTWVHDWGHIAVVGRFVSATLSTISIGLIYLVGAAYFSGHVGLLSAGLLAFSPWAIREAHFSTTETMLVFFLLLLAYFSHSFLRKPSTKTVCGLAFIWGLAIAAKTISLLFGVIPVTAILLAHALRFRKKLAYACVLSALAAAIFFLFSPYTILDLKHFQESMTYETGVALGRHSVPYTLQFVGTVPYLYQMTTMLWQAGPQVFVGLVGLIALAVAGIRKKHKEIIVFLIFPLLYFAWVGTWFAKFSRYNVPFLPFVTLAAAWFCFAVLKHFRTAGLILTILLVATTSLWGLSNWTIYMRPQTKIEASTWSYAHIPENAIIYTEHWNDGLPLDLAEMPSRVYYPNRELLTVYEPDNEEKKLYYADKLATGDYIILSTRRIWATMPRLKEQYPLTSLFYEKLLNEELGYHEVTTFTSYPKLFGVEVNDDTAEESLQVFDHPTVRIFQNTERFTKNALHSIL